MADSRSKRRLTQQQERAVAMRHASVALSAGAGCGKTSVLAERYLSHLDPAFVPLGDFPQRLAQLEQLVAITFTRRAAGEMRQRIRGECHLRLVDEDRIDDEEHWLNVSRGLQRARVTTIDAFCAAFLRSHAVEAGIDPAFRVLDGAQGASLLTEAIDQELRRLLAESDEALLALVADFGLARVRELVRDLLDGRDQIDFAAWAGCRPEQLVGVWKEFRAGTCLPRLVDQFQRSEAVAAVAVLLEALPRDASEIRARLETVVAGCRGLTAAKIEQGIAAFRNEAKVNAAGVRPALEKLGIYDEVKAAFEEIRDRADKLLEHAAWDPEKARGAAEAGLRLLRVAAAAEGAYAELKREAAALDFRDLVRKCRDLLADDRHGELRERISAEIHLMLVDEFQDTDSVQAELIKTLCGEQLTTGRLFFVGDVKQSIYRFRGAVPSVFGELRSRLPSEGQLPLSLNFRSQPAILRFVNALFHQSLGPDYEPLEAHYPQVSAEPAVEFLWAVPDEGAGNNAGALRSTEAEWIARRIRQLVDGGAKIVWDREGADRRRPHARAARPGDFAILLRALSDVHVYEEALRRYELDYYLVGGHAFYAQQEIFDLLNLLRTLNSPADEVALAGVLRSPFFALDDETLFWLASHPRGLAAGLFDPGDDSVLPPEGRGRAEFARRTLTELRQMKDRLPVAALIQRSLALTGYDALLLTEFLGERKLANLRKLIEQARSFDSSGICTLAEFVTQLDEFVSRQPHEALAATEAETSDVIRLMSIHQAKGLEFPVVIVPDLQRSGQPRKGVACTPELGPLVNLPAELSAGTKGRTGRDLYAVLEEEEEHNEDVRLLYVATTRAADYLILSSGVKQPGDTRSLWMRLLKGTFDLESGALRSPLPEGYGYPRIRVTSARPELPGRQFTAGRRVDLAAVLEQAERLASGRGKEPPASVAPLPVDLSGRRQFSFSELSGTLQVAPPDSGWELETTAEGEPRSMADARWLGTLAHALLAESPDRPDVDLAARARHFAEMILPTASRPLANRRALEAAAVAMAGRFRESARFAAIAAARQRYAEIEFLLAWPPDAPATEGLGAGSTYFRGFIDCLYLDADGRWHVLDYKTNRTDKAGVPRLVQTYELQLLLYALAVEQTVGEPPASLVLSFLEPGIEQTIGYSAGVKAEAIGKIDAALKAFRVGAEPAK